MKVQVFGTLRSVMGNHKEVEVRLAEHSTIQTVLDQLIATHPTLGEKFEVGVSIFVNGRSISFLGGLDTRLQQGDRVALFPPLAGG